MTSMRRSLLLAAALATSSPCTAGGAVPWYAQPSVAVSVQSVVFTNEGATLHGILYLPQEKDGPVPAVVVFHGASEPLASTPLYNHLRDGLPQIGIAVLLFDRRGTGALHRQSQGRLSNARRRRNCRGKGAAPASAGRPKARRLLGHQSRRMACNVCRRERRGDNLRRRGLGAAC